MAANHYVIVGGGLAGSLIALAVGQTRRVRVTLVEQDGALAGNHTWSFHDDDLDGEGHRLVSDLVSHRWPRYRVRFPGYTRAIESGYATISSARFASVMYEQLAACGVDVRLIAPVSEIGAAHVRLDDGSVLLGDMVIDARGPERLQPGARAGYQKFVGLEVQLAAGARAPWDAPLLMDATVPQEGGFRFIYVLPFSQQRVLIEDTIYAEDPALDAAAGERAILDYAARAGVKVEHVVRRETGVLPLPIEDRGTPDDDRDGPLVVGYRGGFFHPATGYSLALSVRVARAIAEARTGCEARASMAALARALEPQQRFGRLLNRLAFEGLPAAARRNAVERGYRLPAPTSARVYASRSTVTDRARGLLGRPPAGISWRGLIGARANRPQRELS